MKKIGYLLLMLIGLLQLLPASFALAAASKYTGGLLDGAAISIGATFNNPTSTVTELTDNNASTGKSIGSNIAWYAFSSPKDINSVIVKYHTSYPVKVEFYAASGALIGSYTPATSDGVESLPNAVQNVSAVVLKPVTAGGSLLVYEWNVFGKNHGALPDAPHNVIAVGGDKTVSLKWDSVSAATSYKVKRSTTTGGPYTDVATVNGNVYGYLDNSVVNGTTYYYVVTAVNAAGESSNSNEASATPNGTVVPPTPSETDRALLRITLNNGEEKEYDLSMTEVNAFLAWYEGRASGTGAIMFAIDKHDNNKGPFTSRKDYIIYDKIITFEVNAYTTTNTNDTNPAQQL